MKKVASITFVALSLLLLALPSYAPAKDPTPRPNFALRAQQDTIPAPPGITVQFQMSLIAENGFHGNVKLSCAPNPSWVTCELTQSNVRVGGELVTRFAVRARAGQGARGTIPILVTAEGVSSDGNTMPVVHHMTLHLAIVRPSPVV
jgi:hypothetical protein